MERITNTERDEDDKYYYYESTLPGFSYFAIAEKAVKPTPTCTPTPTQTPVVTPTKEIIETVTPTPTVTQEEKKGIPGFDIVLAILAIMAVYLSRRF